LWEDPAEDAEHVAWARELFRGHGALRPRRLRQQLGTEGAERVRAAYAPRPTSASSPSKDAYDPGNVFHLNQNVAPSG
jgi:hypothetical protein